MGSQYDAYRRIGKVERVERVERNDKTEALDMKRKAKFEAALARVADELRQDGQHGRHHTYADAAARLPKPRR